MLTFPRRVALIAALATIGALSFAGPASAEVAPPEVNEKTLTVTSNDAGDSIALAVAGGFISVNGTATTLAAGANDVIVVNAAGGNDTVDATALATTSYESLTVNGGEGDDLVTGGANEDVLHGDGGEDRLVGFKGKDEVSGGAGNDVMVWNNGDASDRNDGEGGVDEVEVNGAPTVGDDFSAKPNPTEAGWVLFERLNLVKFEITLRAEQLTVNGLGGADHFAPDSEASTGLGALTSLAVNGGSGGDRLDGGDGDDRIVGGTGEDQLAGRAGDDTIVWNNGDGSDPNNEGGPGFDRVEVNGAATAGDAFALAADAEGAGFVRKNLVPFTLEISSDVEALAVNGSGGEDTFSVIEQGSGPLVAADGGAGNDVLSGSGEADSLFGGSGEDTVTGGGGADLLDGGEGADRLFARDGAGDLVRGGAGEDAAQTDRVTVDAIDGVESLDATPVPQVPPAVEAPPAGKGPPARDTSAILPTVGRVTVTRSHGRLIARTRVSCPAAEAGGCRAALTLETAKAIRLGKVRAVLVLGSTNVDLAPGQASTASVRVSNAAAGLATHGRLPARISISSSDAAGNSAARSFAVGLRFPRL
jgi:Ca2+-binding RTX toxin-like protein